MTPGKLQAIARSYPCGIARDDDAVLRTAACHNMAWRHNLQSQATLAHPPPGWTKTPLFLELSALKEHVAAPCRNGGPDVVALHA
jgi:hypothetical protein